MERFLLVEGLVTAGTILPIAGDAAHIPVAAVVAAVLYPKRFEWPIPMVGKNRLAADPRLGQKSHSGMLPDAIPLSSLGSGFCGSRLPEGFQFLKIGFRHPPLHHPDRVDVSKVRMVVVHHGDKRYVSADEALHLPEGVPREVLEVQVFTGVFSCRIEVDDEFEKDWVFGRVNAFVGADFVCGVERVE
jgi:hypothetical protein